MMKQTLFLMASAAFFLKFVLYALPRTATAPVPLTTDVATEQLILQSTVQIAMFEHAPTAGGAEPGSRGLGTLISAGGKTLIVTHDHWTPLTPNLHEVELRDAMGRLLLTLDAPAFGALITYRDGGTMVLQAPDGLQAVVPATLGPPANTGAVAWFVRRDAAAERIRVEVVGATVTSLEAEASPARMRIRSLDGRAVLPGDSGGGVWANGRLIGNVWAAGVRETRYFWSEWAGGSHEEASNWVIAALQPLSGQSNSRATVSVATQGSADTLSEHERALVTPVTKEEKLQATLVAD